MLVFLLSTALALAGAAEVSVADKAAAWRKACEERNEGVACGNLGALYATGQGLEKNNERAFFYYEKACQFGQALRCLRAGTFALNGQGTKAAPERAVALLARGCKLLDPEACATYYAVTHGVKILLDGTSVPLAKPPKADAAVLQSVATTLTLACDKAVPGTCGNLGGLYEEGDAVPRDTARALHFFERACELGEGDRCGRAARYHANGEGTAVDHAKAAALFRKSCELLRKEPCPLAKRAELGLPIELRLKEVVISERGASAAPAWSVSVPDDAADAADAPTAVKPQIEACNQGDARACGNAAVALQSEAGEPKAHPALARQLLEKACGLGRAQRCADLARYFDKGWGAAKSKARAKAARERACELGLRESCGKK